MQSYCEVLFFKSGALHTEYWRVYFELHGEDLAILEDGTIVSVCRSDTRGEQGGVSPMTLMLLLTPSTLQKD